MQIEKQIFKAYVIMIAAKKKTDWYHRRKSNRCLNTT